MKLVTTLFDYSNWAFDRVWSCADQLTDTQFCFETDYSNGSIRNQFIHVMSATARWIQRLQRVPLSPHMQYEDYPTIQSVKKEWPAFVREVGQYLDSLDQKQLHEVIDWEISKRNMQSKNECQEILLHLFNHATDHRSQMLAMMHNAFHIETVEHDLILYLESHQK